MCFLFWSFCSYFFLIMQAMPEGKLNLLSRNTFVFWFCIFVLYFLSRQAFSCSYSWLYQSNGGECFYETALHLLSQVSFAFESHISVNLCAAAMNNCCDDLEALSWLLKLLKPDDLVAQIPLLLPPFFCHHPICTLSKILDQKLIGAETLGHHLNRIEMNRCKMWKLRASNFWRRPPSGPSSVSNFLPSPTARGEVLAKSGPSSERGEKVGGKWWKKETLCVPSR